MPDSAASSDQGLYPIRTVASLSGVNPVTLRAWERRYGLIKPKRTPKGHRLYSREQLELIQRVVELLGQGISIGQIRSALREPAQERAPAPPTDGWLPLRERMLAMIRAFDAPALERQYNEALALYPIDLVTRHLLLPVLDALGERWRSAPTGVAEEHFFAAYLRNKLGARLHHQGAPERGPRLLAACLPGELHETGLLLFCLSAVNAGMSLVLLGADMPLEQLPPVVERAGCAAIILSGTQKPSRGLLTHRLPALVEAVPVPVGVGGGVSVAHAPAIRSAGALALGSDIPAALRTLTEILQADETA